MIYYSPILGSHQVYFLASNDNRRSDNRTVIVQNDIMLLDIRLWFLCTDYEAARFTRTD